MTDGSSTLTRRELATFEIVEQVTVRLRGEPFDGVGELECVGSSIWGVVNNDMVQGMVEMRRDGAIVSILQLGPLLEATELSPELADEDRAISAIAWDAESDSWLVTGRLWPTTFRLRLTPA